ncbi:MAG: OmpA family protein [bacterium]|nr:OmpA family protein [bacterium]
MNTKRYNILLALFIVLFFALLALTETGVAGGEYNADVGTSHSVVGNLGMDASAAGLGWAVTGVDMGLAGLDYNPASGAEISGRSFHLAHLNWVLDSSVTRSALALPFWNAGVVNISLLHFDQGTVDEVLEDGLYTGERLGARDIQLAFGLARPWGPYVNVGLRLTSFHKTLGWERATGVMASVGLMTSVKGGVRVGAAILDFGPAVRFRETSDPSPLRMSIGASHVNDLKGKSSLLTTFNFVSPRDNYSSFGVGTEWRFADLFVLRGGYRRTMVEDGTPDADRFCYGFGVKLESFQMDYTFATKSDFDNTHRLSITFDFSPLSSQRGDDAIARTVYSKAVAFDSLLVAMDSDSLAANLKRLNPKPLPRLVVLQGLRFTEDNTGIDPISQPELDEIFIRLMSTPGVEGIEIQGHVDEPGTAAFKQQLSEDRAKVVRNYLVEMGYPLRQIAARGFGNTRPMVSGATLVGREANTRIEVHLIRRRPQGR